MNPSETRGTSPWILPLIVGAQLFCTSLWFAGNAVLPELVLHARLGSQALGPVTSAVQGGFISGTLVFAVLTIADRHHPSHVFFLCAVAGGLANAAIAYFPQGYGSVLALRFATGFFLAGIYPVGMKIAADHFQEGLGKALGFLVGALVVGTALPHGLRGMLSRIPWNQVLYGVSALAVIGGAMMTLVPRGPYRKPGFRLEPAAAWRVFRNKELRAAAFGYFGHMWELYAFWAFVPFAIVSYGENNQAWTGQTALLSFLFIGIGGPACIAGGYLSGRFGAGNTARAALLLSGICCLSYPLIYWYASPAAFIAFMLCWGAAVIADSPMFSTLVARTASPSSRGTALTIVNCIGFAITILSIQWLQYLSDLVPAAWLFVFLAPGPAFGLLAMRFLPARPAKK